MTIKSILKLSRILLILSGLECLAGCGKIHSGTGTIVPVVKGVSGGHTKSGPVIIDDTADPSTGERLSANGFVMDAWAGSDYIDRASDPQEKAAGRYFKKAVSYSSGWTIADEPTWINKVPIRFWCWNSNAEASGLNTDRPYDNTDTRTFSFSMPSDPSKRGDIVMASASKEWDESSDDDIDLTFHHPLSNVRMELNVGTGLTVTDVALLGVRTEGTFKMTGGTFTWDMEVVNSKPVGNVAESLGASATAMNFFIVPQSVIEGITGLELTVKPDGKDAYTSSVILSDTWTGSPSDHKEWLSDYYYKYKLTITTVPSDPIGFNFTVTLVDWGDMDYDDDGIEDIVELTPNQ